MAPPDPPLVARQLEKQKRKKKEKWNGEVYKKKGGKVYKIKINKYIIFILYY
jgi:uncharacterized protein (DUF2147 family)